MSRGTRQRNFRCEDELWDKAKEAAAERGDKLSDMLRQALANYISEGTKMISDEAVEDAMSVRGDDQDAGE
jgi:hypothetical protein